MYLAKILEPDGSTDIAIGAPVAVLVDEEGSIASFKSFTITAGGSAPAPAASPSAPADTPAASSSSAPVATTGST